MTGTVVAQVGKLYPARIDSEAAPGMKGATFRLKGGIRDRTRDAVEHRAAFSWIGQGCEKALGIGVAGVVEDIPRPSLLRYDAGVHNIDTFGDVGHYAEIVGDVKQRHASFPL